LYLQGGLQNTWTVIASSVEAAFGWNDDELQVMQAWIYVSYLLVMVPFTWLMDKKGNFHCAFAFPYICHYLHAFKLLL